MEPPLFNEPGASGGSGSIFGSPVPAGAVPPGPDAGPIPGGRTVGAGRGLTWIGEAWSMFKDAPGSWVACFIIFILITLVLVIIPILGNIAGAVLSPLLIGGMMIGCREQERNEELTVGHLFAGFKQRSGPLLILGLLELAISLVVMLIAGAIVFLTMGAMFLGIFMGQSPEAGATLEPGFWLSAILLVLLVVALFIPVTMAFWFSPALVALDNVEPLTALKWSFFACLKNILPFLIYGLVMLVLALVATIPLGLGWLVLGPMVIASIYSGYRDLFFRREDFPV